MLFAVKALPGVTSTWRGRFVSGTIYATSGHALFVH